MELKMSGEQVLNEGIEIHMEAEHESGNLIKELKIVIDSVRLNSDNSERFVAAQDRLFAFNVGLLCGLKQGKK